MASFTQGAPLENITTTQSQTTTAPDWYNDYLKNLSSTATQAGAGAQFVGSTNLQNQAFQNVASNVGNYQPLLGAATGQVNQASGMSAAQAGQPGISAAMQTAPSNVQQYMNPYTSSVVDEMTRLGQQNIRQNLAPQATAGIVGAGQFGSTRGAQALGQNITNALQDLGGRQSTALQAGYTQALQASQADMARQLQAGIASGQLTQADIDSRLKAAQQYGSLAGQTQSMGLADVNALSTLGAQQQQIAQNEELFPLQVAEKQAALMKGYTVPTSVTSSYTGPIPGAYQTSPLMQLTSLGSGLAGIFTTPAGGGSTIWDNIQKAFKSEGYSGFTDPSTGLDPDIDYSYEPGP